MAGVTDPVQPPSPGERRLDRPPSDRYREPSSDPGAVTTSTAGTGSTGRALAGGLLTGLIAAVATIVLGGALGLSAGLLVVAAAGGWAIGTATRIGGGSSVAPSVRPWLAFVIAVVAVILGQVGLWLYARTEGGVLTLPDYLAETWGVLVPLQAILAIGGAWWAAR